MKREKEQALRDLLRDFYNLTGIKTCLYDANGREICFYPSKLSRFCKTLRADPEMDRACRLCDEQGFEVCRRTKEQYCYTCHAGLQECISPIVFDGKLLGFVMIGQIRPRENPILGGLLKRFPSHLSDALRSAYDSLPVIADERLRSSCHVLDACAGYALLRESVLPYSVPIGERLARFVRENLAGDVSVPRLCSVFRLSRREIYHLFNEYFHASPARYVKKCRIGHACRLLETTSLPVHRIAEECGIADYNYFSKVFRAAVGTSPTAYRREKNRTFYELA